MQNAPFPSLIPSYEHARLAALQPYQVLSTPGQTLFNDFVSIVARLLDVPMALVSLVRADDVVFIGNAGLPEATFVDRADSMCSVAILSDDLTEFPDVAAEPCALVNPYVAKQLRLGFYAAHAMRTESGQPIGSLCVLDRQPRRLTEAEAALLKDLTLVAQDLLRIQAAYPPDSAQLHTLRSRFDGPVQQSLTRLATLAELSEWVTDDPAEAGRYAASRLDEAQYLARTLHRELQTVS